MQHAIRNFFMVACGLLCCGASLHFSFQRYDGFQRADSGSLGATWLQDGDSISIASNIASLSGSNVYGTAVYSGTFANNQYSKISVGAGIAVAKNVEVVVRRNGLDPGGFVLTTDGTTYTCLDGGDDSTIFTGTQSVVAGDVIEIRASGTTIGFYLNNALINSATNSTYTSGQPGFNLFTVTGSITADNWQGGNL